MSALPSPEAGKRWALRSERVVTAEGLRPAVVVVEGERIVAVLAPDETVDGPLEDLGALALSPGLVDAHVHVNAPGHTDWEGFATATAAAAAGGTTTLVDMPLNSLPTTTSVPALEAKREAARGQCHVDVGFYGGLVPGNAHELEGLVREGVLGIKAFLCPSGLPEFEHVSRADLELALPLLRDLGVPLLAHCELVDDQAPRVEDHRSYRAYAASRPERFEVFAVELLAELAAACGASAHVVHLSADGALEVVRAAQVRGVCLSAETCPHYLYFAAEEVPDGDARFKCAPPIRSARHREALWQGLIEDTIATIGSDHSPCPPAMRHLDPGDPQHGDLTASWGGIASLQWTLPVVWSAARGRGLSIEPLARWLSSAPATLLGLESKGAIARGRDADLVVWDPESRFVLERGAMRARHKTTPYEGHELWGRVERTYLRGRLVYAEGELPLAASGREILGARS